MVYILFNMKEIVLACGYFNPLHIGHVRYLQGAKNIGSNLLVIVNNDEQVKIKGSKPFMSLEERIEIVNALSCVDMVVRSIDQDGTQRKTIRDLVERYKLDIQYFAKGGDSKPSNTPEIPLCDELGIYAVFNVGGGKIQSSSWLIKDAK